MAIGAKVHGRIIKYGLDNDPIIETSLLGLYGELGCITNARKVFDNIPVRDSVSGIGLFLAMLIRQEN
jgi:hypothetical protein